MFSLQSCVWVSQYKWDFGVLTVFQFVGKVSGAKRLANWRQVGIKEQKKKNSYSC